MIQGIASGRIAKGDITRTLTIYSVAAGAYSLDIVEKSNGGLAASESTGYIIGATEHEARAYARAAWKRLLGLGWTPATD
jgi:hypothetical protein